jgi:cyanate permease
MFLAKRVLEEEENVTILKVDDLQRVFLLWMFGCLLATLTFLGSWQRKKRNSNLKQTSMKRFVLFRNCSFCWSLIMYYRKRGKILGWIVWHFYQK